MLLIRTSTLHAEDDLDYIYSLSLEELLQVKITGSTLTPEELKTVPSAVTVFTQKEISRMGLDTLDELMNLVPGFQSNRSSVSSLNHPFSSRGRRIGNSAAEILILVDGIRLADPRNGGSAIVAPKFPLTPIERVEFIRGPGSAIYGSNAMMGVINIITRSNVNQVSISYGSFNRRKAELQASQKIGPVTIDLFGEIETDNGDDYKVQDTFSTNRIDTDDPISLANLNIKLQWHDTYLNLQHNQFESENFYELNGLSNGFNERTGSLTSVALKQSLNWQAVTSELLLSYNHSRFTTDAQVSAEGDLAPISNPSSNDALFASADLNDYNETRFLWHNDWGIEPQSSLQFGIELRHIDSPETVAENNFDLGDLASSSIPIRYYGSLLATTPVQAKSSRDIVGLYGQYQQRLFDKTNLTLGLRHDDFSNIDSHLSPRFGLVQELNNHHSLKLLYGEAFRAPGESELNLLNNPVVLGNPDLKPETVKNSELIWVGQWSDTGVALCYFESRFKDAIVQVTSGGTRIFENEDQDPSKGFEFELSHELNDHWLLRTTYTHITDTPELSFRESDQLASIMVNYQQGNWNANVFVIYHNDQDMPALDSNGNRITLDDYSLLSGKLNYNFSSDWQGFVQAKNLLDKDYSTPPASDDLTEGVPNRGREILAGIVWQF